MDAPVLGLILVAGVAQFLQTKERRPGGRRYLAKVEAAGIEFVQADPANSLMANDLRRRCLESRDLPPPFHCPGVPWSLPESTPVVETVWRRLTGG